MKRDVPPLIMGLVSDDYEYVCQMIDRNLFRFGPENT